MLVSVTRLRVRSIRYLPVFMWKNFLTSRQIIRSAGFSGGKLLIDAHRTFWTLTTWETEQHMKAFRGSGSHVRVMPRLPKWCDEASYTHWVTAEAGVPTWPEAYTHLVSEGRLSRVAHPSANHQARQFAKPRLSPLIGTGLKPARRKH
jgi:hypothetical protein